MTDSISLDQIAQLVVRCSPIPDVDIENTERDLREFLLNDKNLFIIVQNEKLELIGFCGLTPHDEVVDALIAHDPELHHDPERYYVEMMGIEEKYRKSSAFLHLTLVGVESSMAVGIRKFSSHGRVESQINTMTRRLFSHHGGARLIPNWMGSGEAYEYLEYTANEGDLQRMRKLLRK